MALDSEIQRPGLNKQNAARVKKRLDALAAREQRGPRVKQVAEAKYERNMRYFIGWEEPRFFSTYGPRDIRTMFSSIRHKYRVWKVWRDHTGHWPVFSIWFHFLSLFAVIGFSVSALVWAGERQRQGHWIMFAVVGVFLLLLGARKIGWADDEQAGLEKYGT